MRKCFILPALAALFGGVASAEAVHTVRSIVRADARSGRLLRSVVVVPPKVVAPRVVQPVVVDDKAAKGRKPAGELAADAAVEELIDHAAAKYKVDPNLVHAVVKVESNYNRLAVSPAGAEGLMQLIPSTARRFGVSNTFDARQNIDAGVRYLKYLQSIYGNDMRLVLAAYNAGEGAVYRHRGIPRYPETVNYVYQVGRRWGELNRSRRAAVKKATVSAAPAQSGTAPGGPRSVERVIDAEGRIHLRTN